MSIADSAEGVRVLARVGGPPVAACFDCDHALPVALIHWCGELSEMGRVVALLPYCDHCLLRRERR
jgi:hypothetical protein